MDLTGRVPVFDLDGTLLDSDESLVAPFLALGVPREEIVFGRPLEVECDHHGVTVDDYLSHYDIGAAQPFPGVPELVAALGRWGVCSNKDARSGRSELARLRWRPEVARFAEGRAGKELAPVLARMGLDSGTAVFVGDTEHDAACARRSGCPFVVAGWNPRAEGLTGDVVLGDPVELLDRLGLRRGIHS